MSDPRILTTEPCESAVKAADELCKMFTYVGEFTNSVRIGSIISPKGLAERIQRVVASETTALTEQLAAKDRLIHEYQDKDVQE
jgi:hypothetical protein